MKNYLFLSFLSLAILASCSKDGLQQDVSVKIKGKQNSVVGRVEHTSTFKGELAKGDSLQKGVFREKDEKEKTKKIKHAIETRGNKVISYTLINDELIDPGDGDGGGGGYYPPAPTVISNPITDIVITVSNSGNDPASIPGYTRLSGTGGLNGDLNQGAGGKFVYLWYSRTVSKAPVTSLRLVEVGNLYEFMDTPGADFWWWNFRLLDESGATPSYNYRQGVYTCGRLNDGQYKDYEGLNYLHLGEDLNDHAGGNWMFLYQHRDFQAPIRELLLSETFSVSGWNNVVDPIANLYGDLNHGVGGKYIYLHVKY